MIDADVYAHTDRDPDELADWLEAELGTRLHVERNDERDDQKAKAFPDGFLHFGLLIEAGPQELVARLLPLLWEHGIPAVAAADYEDELPEGGGGKHQGRPWPD